MLTLRLGMFQTEIERVRELAEAIKRHDGSCNEVWLTAIGYYPSLDYHATLAEKYVEPARILREAGVRVSLQIANTIGHRDWDMLKPENNSHLAEGMLVCNKPVDTLVGPDGRECWSCYCWRGKHFRKYISGVVKTYCEKIQPECVWIDDDLRAFGHRNVRYGCFCDDCIREFNAQNGTAYTRESLVHEMNYGNTDVRKSYLDFVKTGVSEFVYEIVTSALSVSPNSHFGFEYGHKEDYPDMSENFIIEAFGNASGRPVEIRPGGGFYNDKSPFGEYSKALYLAAECSDLPKCTSAIKAEVEDLPGVAFGKSLGGIINEGTLDLAYGCTGLTFTDFQFCHEPISYHERLLERFSSIRPYWERLSALASSTYRGGACIYRSKKSNMRKLKTEEKPFSWAVVPAESDYNLIRIGVPVTYQQNGAALYLLHHLNVNSLTDRDVEFLLDNPVVADAKSVAALIERGYGEYFDFSLETVYDEEAMEYYTDHPINHGYVGYFMYENPYATTPMQRFKFENVGDSTEIIGEMRTNVHLSDNSYVGPSAIVTKIKRKDGKTVKWAVFGYSIWSDIISTAKRNQILGAMDEISDMPARLLDAEQAVLIPAVTDSKMTVAVTVSSVSQSGTEKMRVLVRNPAGKKITAYTSRTRDYIPTVISDSGGGLELMLPPILPYELVTIFFE